MTKEQVYDSEIHGLMEQIINICNREKIAMLASFDLGVTGNGQHLMCTTGLLHDEREPAYELNRAADMILNRNPRR